MNVGYRAWDSDDAHPGKPEGTFSFDDLDETGAIPEDRFTGAVTSFEDLDEDADRADTAAPHPKHGDGGRRPWGKATAAVIAAASALAGGAVGYVAAVASSSEGAPPTVTTTVTDSEPLTGVPPVRPPATDEPAPEEHPEPTGPPAAPQPNPDLVEDFGPAIGESTADSVVGDNAVQ